MLRARRDRVTRVATSRQTDRERNMARSASIPAREHRLKHGEVVQVHYPVPVRSVSPMTPRIARHFPRPPHALVKIPKIPQVHVPVAIEISAAFCGYIAVSDVIPPIIRRRMPRTPAPGDEGIVGREGTFGNPRINQLTVDEPRVQLIPLEFEAMDMRNARVDGNVNDGKEIVTVQLGHVASDKKRVSEPKRVRNGEGRGRSPDQFRCRPVPLGATVNSRRREPPVYRPFENPAPVGRQTDFRSATHLARSGGVALMERM